MKTILFFLYNIKIYAGFFKAGLASLPIILKLWLGFGQWLYDINTDPGSCPTNSNQMVFKVTMLATDLFFQTVT